jgi:hypothetical protein
MYRALLCSMLDVVYSLCLNRFTNKPKNEIDQRIRDWLKTQLG